LSELWGLIPPWDVTARRELAQAIRDTLETT
jgi:hypothetical protein